MYSDHDYIIVIEILVNCMLLKNSPRSTLSDRNNNNIIFLYICVTYIKNDKTS